MAINPVSGGSFNYAVNQQTQQRKARAANAGGTQKTGGEYDQSQYLRDLNDRLDARIIAGKWNGKDKFGSDKVSTVMIHPDFLRKMHDDPELGAKYEKEINNYAKVDAEARKRLEAQGATDISTGMYINEKGEMESYAAATKTSEGPREKANKDKKSMTEEMLEHLEEKREKEKIEVERQAKKDASATAVSATSAEATAKVDTIA